MVERVETDVALREPGAVFREVVRVVAVGREGRALLLRLALETRTDGLRITALVDLDGRLLHLEVPERREGLVVELERLLAGELGARLRELPREVRRDAEVLALLEDLAAAAERQSRTFAVTSQQLMETLERALRLFLQLRDENEPWLVRHGGPTEELLRAVPPVRQEASPLRALVPPEEPGHGRNPDEMTLERAAWARMVRAALDRYEHLGAIEDRALEGVVDSFLLVLGYVVGGTLIPSERR
jgi:hypothetical protein